MVDDDGCEGGAEEEGADDEGAGRTEMLVATTGTCGCATSWCAGVSGGRLSSMPIVTPASIAAKTYMTILPTVTRSLPHHEQLNSTGHGAWCNAALAAG